MLSKVGFEDLSMSVSYNLDEQNSTYLPDIRPSHSLVGIRVDAYLTSALLLALEFDREEETTDRHVAKYQLARRLGAYVLILVR